MCALACMFCFSRDLRQAVSSESVLAPKYFCIMDAQNLEWLKTRLFPKPYLKLESDFPNFFKIQVDNFC